MELSIEKAKLLELSERSFDSLLKAVENIPHEKLNVSSGNRWSAGQIVEHIIRSQVGIIRTLNGPFEEPDRDPLKAAGFITHALDDDTSKHQASEGIRPNELDKDREQLTSKIRKNKLEMLEAISNKPMDQLFTGFRHWAFGTLTGAEWVILEYHHTARHIRQINQRL